MAKLVYIFFKSHLIVVSFLLYFSTLSIASSPPTESEPGVALPTWVTRYNLPGKFYYSAFGMNENATNLGGQICPPWLVKDYESLAVREVALRYREDLLRQTYEEDPQIKYQAMCSLAFLEEKEGNRADTVRWYQSVLARALGSGVDEIQPEYVSFAQTNLASIYLQDLIENARAHMAVPGGMEYLERIMTFTELYRKAANSGYAPAQSCLGSLYFLGLGVDEDPAECLRLFRLSSEQRYPEACSSLGNLYCTGWNRLIDRGESLRYCQIGGEQEHAPSLLLLARLHLKGIPGILEENPRHAIDLYERILTTGNHLINHDFAQLLLKGIPGILPQDIDRAMRLLESSQRGFAPAKLLLSVLHREGNYGIVQDEHLSLQLLREAAEANLPSAKFLLGQVYLNELISNHRDELGSLKANITAVRLVLGTTGGLFMTATRLKAEDGSRDAQIKMGVCYQFGLGGVEIDTEEALRWYRRAENQVAMLQLQVFNLFQSTARQNFAPAKTLLGFIYDMGIGAIENELRAVELYREAAQQGDPQGKFHYGRANLKGVGGIKKDAFEALKWIIEVAEDADCGPKFLSPLHCAAVRNDIDAIRRFVDEDRSLVNSKVLNEITPLHLASFKGHSAAVYRLLELRADPHKKLDAGNILPIHCALFKGHEGIIGILSAEEKIGDLHLTILDAPVINKTSIDFLIRHDRAHSIFNTPVGFWSSSSSRARGSTLVFKLLRDSPERDLELMLCSGIVQDLPEILVTNPQSVIKFRNSRDLILQKQGERIARFRENIDKIRDLERLAHIQYEQSLKYLTEHGVDIPAEINSALAVAEERLEKFLDENDLRVRSYRIRVAGLDSFADGLHFLKAQNSSLGDSVTRLQGCFTDIGSFEHAFAADHIFSDREGFVGVLNNLVDFFKLNPSPQWLRRGSVASLGDLAAARTMTPLELLNNDLRRIHRGEALIILLSNMNRDLPEFVRVSERFLRKPITQAEDLNYMIHESLNWLENARNWYCLDFKTTIHHIKNNLVSIRLDPPPSVERDLAIRASKVLSIAEAKAEIHYKLENLFKEYREFCKKFYRVQL